MTDSVPLYKDVKECRLLTLLTLLTQSESLFAVIRFQAFPFLDTCHTLRLTPRS